MIKLPDSKELIQPNDLKITNFKNSTLFLISIAIEIASIIFNLISFQSLNIEIKLIIILSITCFILFIDIIFLYIKDRENYFKNTYISNMYYLLIDNIKEVQNKASNLDKRITDINLKK